MQAEVLIEAADLHFDVGFRRSQTHRSTTSTHLTEIQEFRKKANNYDLGKSEVARTIYVLLNLQCLKKNQKFPSLSGFLRLPIEKNSIPCKRPFPSPPPKSFTPDCAFASLSELSHPFPVVNVHDTTLAPSLET